MIKVTYTQTHFQYKFRYMEYDAVWVDYRKKRKKNKSKSIKTILWKETKSETEIEKH